METIRVNMTPCEDIKTIHASQNDNEAREWGFELHNNGEKIDSSSISDQLVFKAYKGGTEEILPTNGSTPITSPFKGDIKYPQGLLSDQEFLYRGSPTEEDGLAKITDIKGNTLNWNQLVQNGNFESTSGWTNMGSTFSVSNNIATVKSANVANQFGIYPSLSIKANHKYFISFDLKTYGTITMKRNLFAGGQRQIYAGKNQFIDTPSSDRTLSNSYTICFGEPVSDISANYFELSNYMIIDLTQLGLDSITSVDEFTSLFPLSYYDYNQGTLLSFNGNGIKTVGKNILVDSDFLRGVLGWNNSPSDSNIVANNAYLTTPFIPIPQGVSQITISAVKGNIVRYWEADGNFNGLYFYGNHPNQGETITRTLSQGCRYIRISIGQDGLAILPSDYGTVVYGQIEFGNQATSYEPYTSSTLSLPISTYFPSGMKSAGSVYDELTENKAITRIGAVDLGSLNWTYQSSSENMYVDNVVSNRKNNLGFNAICSKYQQVNEDTISGVSSLTQDKSFAFQYSFNGRIIVRDTSYTDATVFKQAMADQNVKLYYELATPTETSFTTASLVTENAEIPLSNEDGVLIGKCTEQLSENPCFFDAKIKLSDADGECYSNKLQLHIERKPS